MIVAVTGASGFIGRRLVRKHLGLGDEVRVLTRSRRGTAGATDVECFVADLATAGRDELTPFVHNADVVYHCAGEIRDASLMQALHVRGTGVLIEAAEQQGIGRWVQLSSVGVYGPRTEGVVTEDAPARPVGVYETTKAASDALVLSAHSAGRIRASVLRPSIVFGEDMPNNSLHAMARMVRAGVFFFVGPKGASANYVHVDGVVEALYKCAISPAAEGRAYNLSDWSTMEDFVGAMASAYDRSAPRLRVPLGISEMAGRVGDLMPAFPLSTARVRALSNRSRYPSDRIERELDYRHPMPLPPAIETVVARWKRH